MADGRAHDDGTPPARPLGASYRKLFAASTISNLGDGIGVIAYPWLASAITRNPLLIALVAVMQRLPWLLFSLPAGVITDRYDRRTLMIGANTARAVLTAVVALVVLAQTDTLPGPDAIADASTVITTDVALYLMVLAATLLLGVAEVLYDNSAQTFMPAIVDVENLERANGRLWSTELIANQFLGPPLAAVLIVVAFALPFAVDSATFAVSAVLITLIRPSTIRQRTDTPERRPWRTELADGIRWLWRHDLLRTLAVVLGMINMLNMIAGATLVLYGQEVLGTSATEFAIMGTGAAIGGVIGGWTASWIARRLGEGPSLALTLAGSGVGALITGLTSSWPVVWLVLSVTMIFVVLWNVITVSFRQTVIPDELLGRVNSVYRFFGWGMIPIGAALGGLIVVGTDAVASRELALRMPWFVYGIASFLLLLYAGPRLTTDAFASARAAAAHTDEPTGNDGPDPIETLDGTDRRTGADDPAPS